MVKKNKRGAVRKKQPRNVQSFQVGDHVRVLNISQDLKNPGYDSKSAARREMRTAALFRFCIGRTFKVFGIDRYGNVELHVSNSSAVRKRFGKWHSIWCEPEFVELKRKKVSS